MVSSSAKESQALTQYPEFAPIGAGMALRIKAAEIYTNKILANKTGVVLDRTGKSLSSGGDNDLVLTILENAWEVGYFPQLYLTHLIPPSRLSQNYLARINRASSRSWIQVLNLHGIRPWSKISRWAILPRKIRTFFYYQAWKNPESYIRWQGACGMFEGQADIS